MSGYYAANPHYAPDDYSEQRERFERCELEAGRMFAEATKAQTADLNAVLATIAPYRDSPRWERMRDAANAAWRVATAAAAELYEASMKDLMTLGEVSQETYAKWDALSALEAVSVAMLEPA